MVDYLRQFRKLPQGFINSTDRRVITTVYLDEPETTLVDQGSGLIHTGVIGDVPKAQVPTAANVATGKFYGILVHDHAHYRTIGQTPYTFRGKELVPLAREVMNVRLWADTAVNFGEPLFLIHTAATGQKPGHFKNNAGTNAVAVTGRWVETLSAPGIASAEIFHQVPV